MVNVWNKGFLTKGLLLIFLRRCISFSWMKKMFFYRQNFATINKIANIREIHQHPDRCKKIRMQFFLHFYSILKKIRAREKPAMVWEEALILNSCCLPTNCSVLLLERQETRDDETSLGGKKKSNAWCDGRKTEKRKLFQMEEKVGQRWSRFSDVIGVMTNVFLWHQNKG